MNDQLSLGPRTDLPLGMYAWQLRKDGKPIATVVNIDGDWLIDSKPGKGFEAEHPELSKTFNSLHELLDAVREAMP